MDRDSALIWIHGSAKGGPKALALFVADLVVNSILLIAMLYDAMRTWQGCPAQRQPLHLDPWIQDSALIWIYESANGGPKALALFVANTIALPRK